MSIQYYTNFPQGLTSMGIPLLGAGQIPVTNGKYWFVDGTNGNDGNPGHSIPNALKTLTQALSSALASDVIVVLPGYTQTITGAAGLSATVSGVTIVGLGTGTTRPTINFTTATTAQMVISGSNILFNNFIFTCGFDAIVAMISVTGTDVTFSNCDFNTNNGTMGAVLGILTGATSDRFKVDQCRFLGPATNTGTTTTAQIQYESAVDIQITNSYFTGKMTQAILNVTGTVLRGLINNNIFVIATGTKGIAVAAASTPMITNNRFNVPSGTAPIVAAAGFVAGNIYSAAAGVTAGTASTF